MQDPAFTLYETSSRYLADALKSKQRLAAEFEAENTRMSVELVLENKDLDAAIEFGALSEKSRGDPKKIAALARALLAEWVVAKREARRPIEEKVAEKLPADTLKVTTHVDMTVYGLGMLVKRGYLDVEAIADPDAVAAAIFAALEEHFAPKAAPAKYEVRPAPPISENLRTFR